MTKWKYSPVCSDQTQPMISVFALSDNAKTDIIGFGIMEEGVSNFNHDFDRGKKERQSTLVEISSYTYVP